MRTTTEQKAYSEGYSAYAESLDTLADNPYIRVDNVLAHAWKDGYEMAQDDHREHMESQSPLREEEMDGSYGEVDH